MSEDDALLRAVLASPEDTTVRLAYADWLDERNDPRAGFLRLDVRLSTLPAGHPDSPGVRRRMVELRPQLPPSWLAGLGDYHATAVDPDPLRVEAVAALLGRPPRDTDQGYDRSIDAAAVHPVTGAFAFLECRQKGTAAHMDVSFQLRIRDGRGGATSWEPETYNPYFGCDVGFLEWYGDVVVMIYREKHKTYIARAGIDARPDFKVLADNWVLDGRHVAYWVYQEPTVRRVAVPSFEDLPPLTPDEAAGWGVLPKKFW